VPALTACSCVYQIIKAEDARLLDDMAAMRRAYADLQMVGAQMATACMTHMSASCVDYVLLLFFVPIDQQRVDRRVQ